MASIKRKGTPQGASGKRRAPGGGKRPAGRVMAANGIGGGASKKGRRDGGGALLDWGAADVELGSDDDDDDVGGSAARRGAAAAEAAAEAEAERDARETADDKRLRMAKDLLRSLKKDIKRDRGGGGGGDGTNSGSGSDDDGVSGDDDNDSGSDAGYGAGSDAKAGAAAAVGGDGVFVVDRVGARLERARLEASGTLRRDLAAAMVGHSVDAASLRWLSGAHDLALTCVALAVDDRTALSGSKDNAVLKWDVETGQRTATLLPKWKRGSGPKPPAQKAHSAEVLAVALSADGRFAAAGGRDRLVHVWDLRIGGGSASSTAAAGGASGGSGRSGGGNGSVLAPVQTFSGHRDAVSGLAFRFGTHALYSCSHDRCVKHWDLDAMGYVETLFGHQAPVHAVAAWRKERAVTGGADRTLRLWKVAEGSHSVFRAPGLGGTDCLAMLDDDWFVGGGEDGALTLWSGLRKRPVAAMADAHGRGRWLSAVASLPMSDLVATGSDDGWLRLWRADREGRALAVVASVPVSGVVNGLAVAASARFVLAAVGNEHRLGRWKHVPRARNRLCVVPLPATAAAPDGEGDDGSSKAAVAAAEVESSDGDEEVDGEDEQPHVNGGPRRPGR
ncbi:unnamed protein product [Phaeothamnion confervicola]